MCVADVGHDAPQLPRGSSHTDTWTWTQPQVNGWIAPRTAFGAAIAENKLYVFGGQSAHGALNDLHYLDLGELTLSPQRQRQRFA